MAPKRVASAAAGAAAKKAKKGHSLDAIVEALGRAPGYPAEVASMVASLVPFALESFKDVRHDFQHKAVEMAEQVLLAVEAHLAAKVQQLEATVAAGPAEKTSRETAVSEATATLAAAKESARLKKADMFVKSAAAKEAQAALKTAVSAQKDGDKELIQTEGHREKLEEAKGKIEVSAGNKKEAAATVKALKTFGFEDSLLNTLPAMLNKKVEERGAFDAVVAQQLNEAIQAKLQHYGQVLAEGAAARAARAETVAAAQAAFDAAHSAREESVKANADGFAHAKASEEALHAAKDAFNNHDSELRKVALALDAANAELEGFRTGALVTFRELKETTTPVPEPEPVAPELVAPEAEVAAEVTTATD